MRHGFPVLDESAKSWLEGDEPHDFKARAHCMRHIAHDALRLVEAHASFIKVSKALAHAKSEGEKHRSQQRFSGFLKIAWPRRQFRSLRVTSDDLDAWRDVFFGTQICTEFELLDRALPRGSQDTAWYQLTNMEGWCRYCALAGHDRLEPGWLLSLLAAGVLPRPNHCGE